MEADGEAGSDGKNKSRLGKISCEQSPRQHLSRVTLGATAQVLVTSGKENFVKSSLQCLAWDW